MAPEEKPENVVRLPEATTASRKIGTPIGTVIASACSTEPVNTPRRALALLNANVAADSAARHTPSTRRPLEHFQEIVGTGFPPKMRPARIVMQRWLIAMPELIH